MRVLTVSLIVSAMLSAADRVIRCLRRMGWNSLGSPSAGTLRFSSPSGFAGTVRPSPSATWVARPRSTWASMATMRSRIAGRSSLPSSNRSAWTMCRFSGSDWLFQKSVAWLKWSKNFSPRSPHLPALQPLRDA